jgi:hypothetical protein
LLLFAPIAVAVAAECRVGGRVVPPFNRKRGLNTKRVSSERTELDSVTM